MLWAYVYLRHFDERLTQTNFIVFAELVHVQHIEH